ncbi:MAG: HAMP domain-containing histidine kinase [Candidatus Eremiobacteraeota bacterium]|nr:HAMP domain-containing histidine kinase [Candidatus Eremiobacteraeota bacterium]MBC5802223.1 HAMP domain-containing histidine kinase [Candidatus Eremiobacteraeota bacterium]MBC5825838.1 HAMP domain-containing histidine kinase [Candidatus Eremiobacteraeota bacterium]
MVRRIAEENGGNIAYEPRAPRGSVFTLTIPKAPE